MYFTITRAGLLRNRFRARLFGANHELIWLTQAYANKADAQVACRLLNASPLSPWPVHDET